MTGVVSMVTVMQDIMGCTGSSRVCSNKVRKRADACNGACLFIRLNSELYLLNAEQKQVHNIGDEE